MLRMGMFISFAPVPSAKGLELLPDIECILVR